MADNNTYQTAGRFPVAFKPASESGAQKTAASQSKEDDEQVHMRPTRGLDARTRVTMR